MLEISSEWIFQMLRIGVVISTAVFVTIVLLRVTEASPTTRVLAWLMVLLPSWLFFSFSLEIPWYESNLSQSPEPVFSIASSHHVENEINVHKSSWSNADSSLQSASTGHLFLLTLFALWGTGIFVIAGRYVYVFLKISTALKKLSTPANPAWLDEFEMVFEASQLRRKPDFKVSNNIGPLVCHSNPNFTVVIPSEFWSECNSEQRIAVLQHEFAHIERGDLWALLLGRIFALPQWFNPLVWFALRRLDEAIEMACDDHVLRKSPEKRIDYARSLLALVEFSQSEAAPALSAAGPPVNYRIQRILQPKGIEMKFSRIFTLFTLVSFSLIALLRLELVAQEPQVQEAPQSAETPLVEIIDSEIVLPNVPAPDELEQVDDNEKKRVTYFVGDLIVPLTREKKAVLFKTGEVSIDAHDRAAINEKSFTEIIDLIKNTVRPDSWERDCTVQPFLQNLCLIVSQNQRGHDEIQDLILKLRELNDLVIQFEAHIVVVDKSSGLKAGVSKGATSMKDFERKTIAASNGALVTSTLPVEVGFNGQVISFACQDLGRYLIEPLYLQTVVTADRRAVKIVRLPRHPRIRELQKERPTENEPIAELSDEEKTEKYDILEAVSEGYATLDITEILVSGNGNQKAFLFVRPTVRWKW